MPRDATRVEVRRERLAALTRIALALVALLAAACGDKVSPADECRARARAASRDRKWAPVLEPCQRAVASEPDQPELGLLLANALNGTGKADEALARAERLFGSPVDAGARQLAGGIRAARDELEAAEKLLERGVAGHIADGNHTEAARTAHGLTGVLHGQRRASAALRAARRAVAEATIANDPVLRGRVLLGLAKVLTSLGDERQARSALAEAGSLLSGSPVDQVWVLVTHGVLLLELEDAAGAVGILTSARELAEREGQNALVASARINLAYAERKLGNLDAAGKHIESLDPEVRAEPSVAFVEGLIAADRGDRAAAERLLAGAAASESLDDDYARDIAYQRGLLAARRGEAKAAEDFFRESIATIEKIRDRTEELELRSWLLHQRRAPYEALFSLLAGQGQELQALEVAERLHARSWRDSLAAASVPTTGERNDAPAAEPAQLAPPPPPLAGQALLDLVGAREALIFVDAGSSLWRFRIARGRIALAALPPGTAERVAAWLASPDDDALAGELGAALIPREVAAGAEPLYVVTADRLGALPFAALRRGARRLIDDRPLVRLPGLAAFACARTAPAAGAPVILGDPGGDLAAARREAERVARSLGATAHVGEQATIARLLSSSGASLLHVAAHAEVETRGGVLNLADGRVSAAEILDKRVAPALAVLAGCATAASRQPESWGSLASSFLAAGSSTVVAALRPMSDEDAGALFERFYRAGGAERPAAALAAAQRDLARTRPPRAWADVAVWGAPVPAACAAPSDLAAQPKPSP